MWDILFLILVIILIVIVLIITLSLVANILFNQKVKREVTELFTNIEKKEQRFIVEDDLVNLPQSVQKWLRNSQVLGKEMIQTVSLKQKGFMRMEKDKAWMPFDAVQYFTTEEPGFIWNAKIKVAPLFHIVGRDKYYKGKGNMLIKLLSLIKIVDATGPKLDHGTLIRFLAETVWFPTFALSSYITWEEIDAISAKAIMSYRDMCVEGIFNFNEEGEALSFEAERYMESNGTYSLESWVGLMKDYQVINGLNIPTKVEIVWKLKEGDFNWYKAEVVNT